MKELTPKKINKIIYILIAIFLVLPILALKPAWDILNNLSSEVVKEKANLQFLSEKNKALSELKKRYGQAKKSSNDFDKTLPTTKEASQFINSLEVIALEYNIPIIKLEVDPEEDKGGTKEKTKKKTEEKITNWLFSQTKKVENYYKLPIRITLEGDYSNFYPLLSKLETEKRFADIQILEIKKPDYTSQTQTVEAILDLVIYLKP